MRAEGKRPKNISAVKLALLAKQMREQTDGIDLIKSEPIAIIGMGCRFPAGANDPEKFWELLTSGKDAITEVPSGRWNIDSLYDPDHTTAGKMNTRWGGFVDNLDKFDPEFFGITPREALQMDPQQRMLMEVAYESLESAGLARENLAGSPVGVFVACSLFDYSQRVLSDVDEIDAYGVTGNFHCFLANRLSFLFNFRGPSLALDTACSSSLVAVHLAVKSLRNRDCDLALAGGVNAIVAAETSVALSQWGMLSPDGRCKTFDSRANGFVRSEGCGVIVLKRLADALADKDSILAVIRGTAVNQDGRSTVITAPNGMAQRAVLKQALADALVEPEEITVIEAHGTGTILGDPIEFEALNDVMGQPVADRDGCFLSSVKTNIGHLEAAAGMAGIIKTILCFQHGAVPPHLHFENLNPHISLQDSPFIIPTENQTWNPRSGHRFAGVSSFGFGGTNAHVILEEAPRLPAWPVDEPQDLLLPLSAHTPQALRDLAEAYVNYLPNSTANLQDIGYTTTLRRSHLDYRLAVSGRSKEELAEKLSILLNSRWQPQSIVHGQKTGPVFVFSGQGPQWWAMGRQLLENEPIFRASVEKCHALFRHHADWSLLDELLQDEANSRLDETEVAQPALFALQVALGELWRARGVIPAAIVGHSIGEVAAAYTAGILSLEDAVQIVYHRARLMQQATGNGKMASVEIPVAQAQTFIAPYRGRLSIAAVNSPTTTVLSGETEALNELLASLEAQGISSRMLRVNYAFHSAQMEPFALELSQNLRGIKPLANNLPIYSTVTGQRQDDSNFDAVYWGRNVRQTVQFADAVMQLIEDGFTTFLEISPHPVLAGMILQCLETSGEEGLVTASLRRHQDEQETMLNALGDLYSAGYPVAWDLFHPKGGRVVSNLPSYAWQRERFWVEKPQKNRIAAVSRDVHPLLGRAVKSPLIQGQLFNAQISPIAPAFFNDHRIWGNTLVPAAAYLESALSATALVHGVRPVALNNVFVQEALLLPYNESRSTQLHLADPQNGQADFKFYSLNSDENWVLHVEGSLSLLTNEADSAIAFSPQAIQSRCEPFDVQQHYDLAFESGIQFGPSFHTVEQLWRQDGEALAAIRLPAFLHMDAANYQIHPVLLDACIQTMAAALPDYGQQSETYLPIYCESLQFYHSPGEAIWSHVQLTQPLSGNGEVVTGDVQIFDASGRMIAVIQGLRLKRTSREALRRIVNRQLNEGLDDLFYKVKWKHADASKLPTQEIGKWLILADQAGVGEALMAQLEKQGNNSIFVQAGATYRKMGENRFEIDFTSLEDYQRLIRDAFRNRGYRGVIHLWGLDTPSLGEANTTPVGSQQLASGSTLYLLKALTREALSETPELWLITRDAQPVGDTPPSSPEQATLWGVANTIALEQPDLRCVCLDLDPALDVIASAAMIIGELEKKDDENQIGLRGDERYVPRLLPVPVATSSQLDDKPMTLTISERGVLDHLVRIPMTRTAPGAGEVEVLVRASGLNFRDVLNALGMYPGDPGPLGDEFVGEITRLGDSVMDYQVGDIVLGMTSASFSSYVVCPTTKVIPKPVSMSDEAAATIPITFMTAYYALDYLAGINAGDRVLIHAAAGGVGLAAVQLAQRAGAEIFATAGSPEKRAFLTSLGVQHVLDSRSLDFADEIMALTDGYGVDVILNSLAGDFIHKSFSVLADDGRFLEIGKTGIWAAEEVAQLNPTFRYYVIYLGDVVRDDPQLGQKLFHDLWQLFEDGALQPLPQRVYPIEDATDAFRYMAQAKHIGKIVLKHAVETPIHIRSNATYLITGGFGGIGLHIAGWLAEQGAQHLVLAGRRTPSETAQAAIRYMESMGTQVITAQVDIAIENDVTTLLAEIDRTLPPLRGIIHSAGVLDDGILLHQDWPRFINVFNPKLNGAWNLSQHAAHFPLDFLTFFSAGAALFGSAGQGSYTAANTFLDSFAHFCRAQGLPAFSINWGAWDNVGMTAGLNSLESWSKEGVESLTPEQGVQAFSRILQHPLVAQIAVLPMRWSDFAHSNRMRPFFAELTETHQPTVVTSPQPAQSSDLLKQWAETPPNRRRRLLLDTIRQEVIRVLGLRSTTVIDPRQPLNELGLDSLMAVELRNTLISLVGMRLPATLLFDYPTGEALVDYLTKHVPELALSDAKSEEKSAEYESRYEAVAELQQMSDADAEALLLAELDKLNKGQ